VLQKLAEDPSDGVELITIAPVAKYLSHHACMIVSEFKFEIELVFRIDKFIRSGAWKGHATTSAGIWLSERGME
jgi:hypothetical protein